METFNLPSHVIDLQYRLHSVLSPISTSTFLRDIGPSTTADSVALLLFFFTTLGYLTHGRIWDKSDPHYHVYFERPQLAQGAASGKTIATRDIAQRLRDEEHHCVIFWGSQSGTSERFADTLGRELLSYFGIHALVADLSDYDAESISRIQMTHFAIFILSTYGEGDPSDNTAGLWDWIRLVKDKHIKLETLRYLAFGLGNSNYKYYNRVLDVVADALDIAGASALIPRRKADDANGGTEEDFQAWKDEVFSLIRTMGYEEKTVVYQPSIKIDFSGGNIEADYLASSVHHQQSTTTSAIVPLAIKSSRELFAAGQRNCVHMELDLGNSDIVYKTGDHIGIWPCNPEEEVNGLLDVLGQQESKTTSLIVTAMSEAKTKVPSPTTLETAFRHHLEICGPVSRKTVLEIAQFAPTSEAKSKLLAFAQDRERYENLTANTHITLARLLKLADPAEPWTTLPLTFVIENLLPLQPRYYSISSSSVISPRRIAITALVVNKVLPNNDTSANTIHGLTSNYLLSTSNLATSAGVPMPTYLPGGNQTSKVLAHVRKSKFKLPITSSTPVIMISAGTGFAPFRAFLQERAKLEAIGKPVGKMILFFGCRNQDDFIYREEIEKIRSQLGDKLEVITAFSRSLEGGKVYVQDQVAKHAANVLELLASGANIYICGKASMAREVDMKLEEAFSASNGLGEADVKAWADGLKKRGKWRADVWG